MHRVVLALATTVVALTACSSAADRVDDLPSAGSVSTSPARPARAVLPGGWLAAQQQTREAWLAVWLALGAFSMAVAA